ncbi:MAG: DUF1080 domain-containing protein [Planctomycetes bacterium]|nr:DUF1080 domain-containing protein [Planctomycetota bacterium]
MNACRRLSLLLLVTTFAIAGVNAADFAPDQSKLPVAPPKDAVILFDGEHINLFLSKTGGEANWPIEDRALVSSRGGGNTNHIVSKLHFRDADIHVEFMLPEKGSGNSGVYIHGQMLQSHQDALRKTLVLSRLYVANRQDHQE